MEPMKTEQNQQDGELFFSHTIPRPLLCKFHSDTGQCVYVERKPGDTEESVIQKAKDYFKTERQAEIKWVNEREADLRQNKFGGSINWNDESIKDIQIKAHSKAYKNEEEGIYKVRKQLIYVHPIHGKFLKKKLEFYKGKNISSNYNYPCYSRALEEFKVDLMQRRLKIGIYHKSVTDWVNPDE